MDDLAIPDVVKPKKESPYPAPRPNKPAITPLTAPLTIAPLAQFFSCPSLMTFSIL